MLKSVHAYEEIEFLSDAELDKYITDIKRDLHRKGLKDEVVLPCICNCKRSRQA